MSRLEGIEQEKKVHIIAEIGMNHDGSFGLAKAHIDAAVEAGVDYVKFQTHIPEAETLRNAPAPTYFTQEPRFDYFKRTSFSLEQWKDIRTYCDEKHVKFLSSPFSFEAVDVLEQVRVDAYKIPSGELTNVPLIEYIAKTGKLMLVSSGMSSYEELDESIARIRQYHSNLVVMQCTSEYPCLPESVGLNVIHELKGRYGVPVGFSDHTLDMYASLAAVTLGAVYIEKHFTLSKKMYGPDAYMSLEPHEMSNLVKGIRFIEKVLQHPVNKNDLTKFSTMKETFQKSIVTVKEIKKGSIITRDMLGIKKPGTGLAPKLLEEVIGKKTVEDVPQHSILKMEDIQWE